MKKSLAFVLAALLLFACIPMNVYAGGCSHEGMIAPTCTAKGVCYDCGIAFAPLGHNYDDDSDPDCNNCGEKREIDANGTPVAPDVPGDSEDTTEPEVPVVPEEPEEPDDPQVCGHEYSAPCDPECNLCGEWRDTGEDYHSYDNPCDAFCNECGWERIPRDHVYDYYCSTVCIMCGFVREDPGHSYDADCAAECYWCGYIREPLADHSYSNDCDPECNNCSYWRGSREHQYDNQCDAFCNVCGGERWVGDHWYENRCDTDCNYCGFTRLPEGDHEYDRNCDKECNICGYVRDGYDHVYSDTYDENCNICGEQRYVPANGSITEHPRDAVSEYETSVYLYVGYVGNYTCTWYMAANGGSYKSIGTGNSVSVDLNKENKDIKVYCQLTDKSGSTIRTRTATLHLHTYDHDCDEDCNGCEYLREKRDHYYDSSCDADCNSCGAVRVPDHAFWSVCEDQCRGCGFLREAPHLYSTDCDEECDYCGHRRTPPKEHTYEYPCSEYCNVCSTWRETEGLHTFDNVCDRNCNLCDYGRDVEGHRYDNDCDAYCNNCGEYRRPRYHWYDNDCDPDCNTCGALREAGHDYDDDYDEYCNQCGAWREVEKEEPDVPVVPDVPSDPTVCPHANKVEPTCTNSGYCRDCGIAFSAIGHSYDDDYDPDCNNCGEEREIIDTPTECSHEFVSRVINAPTCGNDGLTEFMCILCGDWYTESIPATGNHTYDDENDEYCNQCGAWREVEKEEPDVPVVPDVPSDPTVCPHANKVEPTCTNSGYCRDCGIAFSAFGHTYDDDYDEYCNNCGEWRDVEKPEVPDVPVVPDVPSDPTVCPHANKVEPTCTNRGYCRDCGIAFSAFGHTYDDDYDPDCNNCGEEREINDTPTECSHEFVSRVINAPTCGYAGLTEYMCILCGDWYTESIPATGNHTYDDENDEYCNQCGAWREVEKEEPDVPVVPDEPVVPDIPAVCDHQWTNATCTTPKTCEICGETDGEALDHSYTSFITAPDCENGGFTAYVCSRCNRNYVDNETAPLGHNWTAATCTKAKTCSVCKATDGKALGHKYAAATCTKAKTCSVCKATSGKALGHKYAAATCTKAKTCSVCKATSGKALGHKYAAATCTKAKTCSVCKATSGKALGHKYAAATCTKAKTCSVCKATSGKALGHSYKTTTTKATLTKNGSITKKCTVCGNVASKTVIKYAKTFTLSANTFVYNGKVKTPTVTVKDSAGKVLKKGTDYTVTLSTGRTNVGTYKVTITMKGNYQGTKTLTFKINPAEVNLKSLKASARSFTATWTPKTAQVTGYEIQYSLKKNFSNSKTATVTKASTKTKTVSSLSRGKTYYVRIRTYKSVGGVKFYSAWSASMYAPVK